MNYKHFLNHRLHLRASVLAMHTITDTLQAADTNPMSSLSNLSSMLQFEQESIIDLDGRVLPFARVAPLVVKFIVG